MTTVTPRDPDERAGGGVGDPVDQSSPAAEVATGRDWQRSVTFFVVLAVLVVPFLLLLLLVTRQVGAAGGRGPGSP